MNPALIRMKVLPMKYLRNLHNVNGPVLYTFMQGEPVKLSSQRYAVFQASQVCPHCGLEASYLAVEKDALIGTARYHINMYGVNESGEEILFTKDHIKPKSLGGANKLENYQTMCVVCNGIKGNQDIK
jgi:hypothetical protein